MSTPILYERSLPHGPSVRIRRTTEAGSVPVVAVLEVDRRAGTPRASTTTGYPPPLLTVEGATEPEVIAQLEPYAKDDAAVARLLREKGLR
jgi:hypothetical protein